MTPPVAPNGHGTDDAALRRRRKRRWIALAAVLSLIVVAALLMPEVVGGRTGDSRLTTFSTNPQGAKLIFEVASRLGWRVARWTAGGMIEADRRTIIGVLAPVEPLGAVETHNLLEHVRSGAALIYVMNSGTPLDDSLRVKRSVFDGIYEPAAAGIAEAPRVAGASDTLQARHYGVAQRDTSKKDDEETEASVECANAQPNGGALALWPDQTIHLYRFEWAGPRPAGTVVFARASLDRSRDSTRGASLAAAGFPEGRGRVVVISDADVLRNDVLRVCRWGIDVVAVRMLEYLSVGEVRRDHLLFDEYHQGFGTHPGTMRAIFDYLSRAASGHVLLQAMLGGLVLLLALGPRALPAYDAERIERRSPLEHVTALAQAYGRVGGTRTATSRLLRGVRRRVDRGVRRNLRLTATESDALFLEDAARVPALADDVALVRRALAGPIGKREFEAVGDALKRVEETLLTQRR
ncbi:MAG TPA: hypothetical protein VJN70_06545 [Gemmatimonadaceae bacterium]|nr:hypothetical protein [Gemmatimonadaceae bacterium]